MRALYLGLALCAACGSIESIPEFTLNTTPPSVNIPIASSKTVTLTIDRTGPGEEVMLTAQNLPAGITATFSTNPIPETSNASEVTFAVAPGTPPGTAHVTIVGSSGATERSVAVDVIAETITVSGTVRGGRAGVPVRLVGRPSVTSGADGTFTFTDVSPPYDLYTLGDSGFIGGTIPSAIYYQGLTRPDPVVSAPQPFSLIFFTFSNATVNGTKSGTADTTNPMLIAWSTGGQTTATPNAYSFTASWSPAAGTKQGTLYGFQFSRKTTGAPDTFTGYAASGLVTLTENAASTVNLSMTAPSTAALTGQITAPVGFPNPTITLHQQLGATSSIQLWTTNATTAADATIPLVSAGKAALHATATLDGATTSFVHPALDLATDVTFALPPPATQSEPLDTATGITATTPFTWSAAPGTVYEVNLSTTTTTGTAKARYTLYTTATSATVPAVPELALAKNQSFTWSVYGYGPTTHVNDAASVGGLESVVATDFDGRRHWFTNSPNRTFTTAP